MKEGVGGTVALGLVMFFIVIIASYMAFTINYSKAFKVKSKLIDVIQKYDNDVENKNVTSEMNSYLKGIGYSANSDLTKRCGDDGYKIAKGATGWCYKVIENGTNGKGKEAGIKKKYVKVRTFVSVDIPVINRIFGGLRIFTVEGSTKTTYIE